MKRIIWLIIWFCLGIFVLPFLVHVYGRGQWWILNFWSVATWWQYGDYIGWVLGTILLAVAVYFSYQTYQTQKEELEHTKNSQKMQEFENKFFNMVNLNREIIKNLYWSQSSPVWTNIEHFWLRVFESFCRYMHWKTHALEDFSKTYSNLVIRDQNQVGFQVKSFVENTIVLINFLYISSNQIPSLDRGLYEKILYSLLSMWEVFFILNEITFYAYDITETKDFYKSLFEQWKKYEGQIKLHRETINKLEAMLN